MSRPYFEGERAGELGSGRWANPYQHHVYERDHDSFCRSPLDDPPLDDYERRRAERDWEDGYAAAEHRRDEQEREEHERRESARRLREEQLERERLECEEQQYEEAHREEYEHEMGLEDQETT